MPTMTLSPSEDAELKFFTRFQQVVNKMVNANSWEEAAPLIYNLFFETYRDATREMVDAIRENPELGMKIYEMGDLANRMVAEAETDRAIERARKESKL